MSRLSVAVEIDATPPQLWAFVERIEDHVDWMADAVAIRFTTEQHRGAGTAFVCDTRVGPIRLADRMEITEWIPGSVIGVRHEGLVGGHGRFTLVPIDLGRRTRFTWEETLVAPWWLGGWFGSAVGMRLVLRPIWRGNLRRLKAIVEAAPTGPTLS